LVDERSLAGDERRDHVLGMDSRFGGKYGG